ncbi:RsmE family RNA methyltransferase [Microbacterium sp. oral taxon 186 str. F0373]|uniref:16S rRNA (uracil(1498)-N(3))-methyltransferase n=1 Tax=Microbacterium sp. oral taxon 186 TaxID=712383 RepID=UPI00034E9948|nr:16S rRNA (uracil(1498)-N(3))-methyltransferase [Microbacterium sp. oral taxon 186]EPD83259.1 RsmE family RNA methyltransferase [Microbacterium sp. oral taxon 186 str. F0373]
MALHFLVDEPPTDGPAVADAAPGDEIVITGAEAHHAAVVRRVRVGEEVTVGDGAGVWLTGVVAASAPKRVAVTVTGRTVTEAPTPRLVLAQALAKGDRDELAVQAATELGVDEIVPWQGARSVSRWSGDKAVKGVARWQSIVREAAKQAHRSWVPRVSTPVSVAGLAARAAHARVLVLEPTASVPLSALSIADSAEIVLVVGPEGGIAPDELDALAAAGATAVRLGDTVLRTSTAGPAALAVVNARLGRW